MFKRTLLLVMVVIGAPVVRAHETNPHMHAITHNLKTLIDQADSASFKAAFDQHITQQTQQWLITQENAADCATTLLNYAQEKRDALQQKYAVVSDQSKDYKTLAKGAGQCYLAICGALGATLATAMYALQIMQYKLNIPCTPYHNKITEVVQKIIKTIIGTPSLIIAFPVGLYDAHDFTGNELQATAAWLIPTILACVGAKYLTAYGTNNIKHGWNYKAHLETQIKNLDEIIEYIQNEEQI